jgi:hypothetical protein
MAKNVTKLYEIKISATTDRTNTNHKSTTGNGQQATGNMKEERGKRKEEIGEL